MGDSSQLRQGEGKLASSCLNSDADRRRVPITKKQSRSVTEPGALRTLLKPTAAGDAPVAGQGQHHLPSCLTTKITDRKSPCIEGACENGSSCNYDSLPLSVYDVSASQDVRLLEGHTNSRVSACGMLNIHLWF